MTSDLWRRIALIVGAVLLILCAYWLAIHIPKTISIFLIAAFIAFGVQPIAARLERRMSKPIAVAIVFFGLLLVIAIFLFIVVPLAVNQTQLLVANIPGYATTAQSWLVDAETSLEQHFPTLKIPASELNFGKIGASQVSGVVAATIASLGAIAVNTATGLFIAFSSIILSVFFLLTIRRLPRRLLRSFRPNAEIPRASSPPKSPRSSEAISPDKSSSARLPAQSSRFLTAVIGFKFSLSSASSRASPMRFPSSGCSSPS